MEAFSRCHRLIVQLLTVPCTVEVLTFSKLMSHLSFCLMRQTSTTWPVIEQRFEKRLYYYYLKKIILSFANINLLEPPFAANTIVSESFAYLDIVFSILCKIAKGDQFESKAHQYENHFEEFWNILGWIWLWLGC